MCFKFSINYTLTRRRREENGSYLIVYQSTTHPQCPVVPNYTRARLDNFAIHIGAPPSWSHMPSHTLEEMTSSKSSRSHLLPQLPLPAVDADSSINRLS